jgi:hypothetical protein
MPRWEGYRTTRESAIGRICARTRRLAAITETESFQLECYLLALADKLHLTRLAKADSFNLLHDSLGILRRYNADAGTFSDCWRPRFGK